MAMGVFEGHMAKMADGFRPSARPSSSSPAATTRRARRGADLLRLAQFTDEEWELCPPVVAVGGDGAMYDIGFQNLSRADGLGQADQGAGGRHPGLLEHRRPGLHLGLHRPGLRHGAVRQGVEGQAGAAQGDRPDRHGAPHHLRAAEHHRLPEPHDRGLHPRPEGAAAGAVQPLQLLPARARHRRRHERRQAKLAVESRAYPLFRYDPAAATSRPRSASTSTATRRWTTTGRSTRSSTRRAGARRRWRCR
jgi:pyruvate-ferredoxin/flavodoxin oxidoreductase